MWAHSKHDFLILTKAYLYITRRRKEVCLFRRGTDTRYNTNCKWNGRIGNVYVSPESWIGYWNNGTDNNQTKHPGFLTFKYLNTTKQHCAVVFILTGVCLHIRWMQKEFCLSQTVIYTRYNKDYK
jgi:hypothetical protein